MSCAIVPTETRFQVVTTTSDSLSTFFSTLVTTSPTTVTSTIACSASASNSSCAATTLTVTSAVSTTTTLPVTLTAPVTFTRSNPTLTLFSTSCSSSSTSDSSTGSPSSDTLSQPLSLSTPTFLPSSTSVSTFSSLVSSSAVITLSDGNVTTTQVIVTTTSPPSVVVTSSTSPSSNQSSTRGGGISSSKAAPIIGGAVGGVIAVLAIIGVIWYIRVRVKRLNDILEEDGDEGKSRPRMSLGGEDVQPRPYRYGLVGHPSSPSPPGSPPFEAVNSGHSPSNSLSFLNAPPDLSGSSPGLAPPSSIFMTHSLSDLNSTSLAPQSGHARPFLSTTSSAAASTLPLLERPVNHTRTLSVPTVNLSMVPGSQLVPLSPQPHSAGRSLQSASLSAQTTSTEPIPHLQNSPITAKRRLLASLPQGAAPPVSPSLAIESSSSVVQVPHTESVPPPIRRRNPNRSSSSKGLRAGSSNAVTVHVDGGPAAETDEQSRPGGTEPPAYSPT